MKKLILTVAVTFGTLFCSAQYTKLLDFDFATSGAYPEGDLFFDGTFLYGTTEYGGLNGSGNIFKINPNGTSYDTLMSFSVATTGTNASGSLIYDGTFLYGMTGGGGANGYGTIYKIKPDGTGYTTLHDFDDINGKNPYNNSLIYDGTFLYGMARGGVNGYGVIFKISPDGTGYVKLLDFDAVHGSPCRSLIYDGTFLYGMTSDGGTNNFGTIFKIKPDGTDYVNLLDFNGSNGKWPQYGSLIYDGTFLYGMTKSGGVDNFGVVFKIKPDGTGYLKLLDFDADNGRSPYGSLTSDGNFLYGMTKSGGAYAFGNIFQIKPDGTGYSNLHDFSDALNGNSPKGSLIYNEGVLYGMTDEGGVDASGTLFKYGIATGISMNNTEIPFTIYPNPTKDYLTIKNKNGDLNTVYVLLNSLGQQVFTGKLTGETTKVDVTKLPAGLYFMQVGDEEKQTFKVMKK
jgi:uncharacterized repeat protein (TIGR03803 family)